MRDMKQVSTLIVLAKQSSDVHTALRELAKFTEAEIVADYRRELAKFTEADIVADYRTVNLLLAIRKTVVTRRELNRL